MNESRVQCGLNPVSEEKIMQHA